MDRSSLKNYLSNYGYKEEEIEKMVKDPYYLMYQRQIIIYNNYVNNNLVLKKEYKNK